VTFDNVAPGKYEVSAGEPKTDFQGRAVVEALIATSM
jgi:hypothetical protein